MTSDRYRLGARLMQRFGPEAFDGPRLGRGGTWLVDFSAEWCGFCDDFLPMYAALEGNGEFEVAIGDLTDVNSPLWDQFELKVTPTMIAFRDGAPVVRVDGRRNIGLTPNDIQTVRTALAALSPGGPRR
jgi:hypothetical protein